MSDNSRAADGAVADHPHRFVFIAALFLLCWVVALAVALSVDKESFGMLALSGAFGTAVFPWVTGVAGYLLGGAAGRYVGPIVSILAFGVLAVASRL